MNMRFIPITMIPGCLVLVLLFLNLSSCGLRPGPEKKTVHVFDYLATHLQTSNAIQYNLQARKDFEKTLLDAPYVYRIPANTVLKIRPLPPEQLDADAIIAIDGPRQIRILKDLYWTADNDVALLSFNNKDWFSWDRTKTDLHENIIIRFMASWAVENNTMTINAPWQIGLNPEIRYWWKNHPRELRALKAGDVLSAKNDQGLTLDLRKYSVFIPAGTLVRINMQVQGNLFKVETTNETFVASSLADIWLFRSPNVLGMSFDGQDWGNYFWSFIFDHHYRCSVGADGNFDFENNAYILRK